MKFKPHLKESKPTYLQQQKFNMKFKPTMEEKKVTSTTVEI